MTENTPIYDETLNATGADAAAEATGTAAQDAAAEAKADAKAEEAQEDAKVARDNLREAGDALLAAGSALGAAIGKFAEGLPERFKNASDSARESLNQAATEGEVRSIATNWANEAEKVFNNFRERDLKFTDDARATLTGAVKDIRESFNERMDKVDTSGVENTVVDLRTRFDAFADRLQNQFAAEPKPADAEAGVHADVIDGEVVEADKVGADKVDAEKDVYVDTDADLAEDTK
ncbi:hypothetical protein JKI95_05630 [Corynebacterium aquatimens]|uniref:CGLAU_01105 family protein n=1 Tax=Corynebacterium aquatimens TaxID=1190508 RepID=UPI00253FB0DE|nr:CGLAU_01105 family protein [Corynebacterium aquatimens]QYH20348.1 hypothetical protein JKI95_05630 [Corynebacterium aquatimens]